MPITPVNFNARAFGLVHSNMLWLNGVLGKFAGLRSLGFVSGVFRDDADPFVAHIDIVTPDFCDEIDFRLRRIQYPASCKPMLMAAQAIARTTHGTC